MSASKVFELRQGERFYFERHGLIGLIKAGHAEIYATDKQERMFLTECGTGAYFFGAMDEFQAVETYLFARTEMVVEIYEADSVQEVLAQDAAGLRAGMRAWFRGLLNLNWVRFFAIRRDDFIGNWNADDFLTQESEAELWPVFLEHQNIFILLLHGQFNSLKKYFDERLERRRKKKEQLLADAVGSLLDEESYEFAAEITQNSAANNSIYVMRRVAKALHMNPALVDLPQEILKRTRGERLLHRLAGKAGMQLRPVLLTKTWYTLDSGVLVVRYQGQLTAAVPLKPGQYKLYNNKITDGVDLTAEAAAELEPRAFQCYAGFPARKLKLRDLLKFMVASSWRQDYKFIIAASFVAGIIPLLTPVITETIFSDIIPVGDREALATVTQVMMVMSFTMAAISLVRSISVLRITSHLDIAVEAALWGRLLSLPASFFKKYQTGEIVQRMDGIQEVKTLVTGEFVSSVFNTVFSLWSIVLMCYYSFKLTGVASLVWLVYLALTAFIYKRIYGFQKNAVTASNKTSGQVLQIFTGLTKFRSQGAEEQAFNLWAKCFGEQWKWNLKLRWQDNYSAIINGVQPLILTLVLYYITYNMFKEQTNTMTYAQFIGFQAAFTGFNTTMVNMIPLASHFYSIRPHLENLRPILENVPEQKDDKVEAGPLSGDIEIKQLSFRYNEDGPDVLSDINLQISPGQSVAIVGRSGCGKSTLLRLLLGFEEPRTGAVFYDGMDLKELTISSVRSQMGVVLQNGMLMAGDIFTNIVGTSNLTMEDAWLAAERVGLADDIRCMPMQMYTTISEGSGNISGGQRQRILIARSIVHNPTILLLDEATSALDNITQAIVTASLEKMACTRIVVAHRLNTIKNSDRILVMDAGRIVEDGSYEELMAQDGIFAQLARRQLV